MTAETSYDVIILGAGSMGIATSFYMARKGIKSLVIDAFDPPHEMGSHHGETRIIRHAYSMDPAYIALALRAQQLWLELDDLSGIRLFQKTGVLRIGARGSATIQSQYQYGEEFSIPIERINTEEIEYRWPGIRLPGLEEGCFEPEGGILFSRSCIASYRALAIREGIVLRTNEPVIGLTFQSDSVAVQTTRSKYLAGQLIVCGGAWTSKLLSELQLPIKTLRKAIAWFEPYNHNFEASRGFPAFLFNVPLGEYYGLPSLNECGLKLGRHDGGQRTDPDSVDRCFGAFREDEDDLRSFLRTFMPEANGPIVRSSVCTYAMTPDEHFIIDSHPNYPHVFFAAGFSGHGFKFSSVVGEILADLATTGQTSFNLSLFQLKRQ